MVPDGHHKRCGRLCASRGPAMADSSYVSGYCVRGGIANVAARARPEDWPVSSGCCHVVSRRRKSVGDESILLPTCALRTVVDLDRCDLSTVSKHWRIETFEGGDRRLGNAESAVATASRPTTVGI